MQIKPASDFTIAQLAQCSNEAFADYFGHPISMTPDELAAYMPSHGISRERSLVACSDDDESTPIAFALMAYRDDLPGHARLAAMGVVPSCAGRGVGARLVAAVVAAARADGTRTVWLEVITKNAPAVRLYSKHGFEVVRSLAGWAREADSTAAGQPPTQEEEHGRGAAALEERAPDEVLALLKQHGAAADLPWQLWHQYLLSTRPQACRAFRLGPAYCAISDPADESKDAVSLLGVAVAPEEARGQGAGTALLRAVVARYPGRKWKAPATGPREYGETIAKRLGFVVDDITMDLMKLSVE